MRITVRAEDDRKEARIGLIEFVRALAEADARRDARTENWWKKLRTRVLKPKGD